jgi:subtilase family serine protease
MLVNVRKTARSAAVAAAVAVTSSLALLVATPRAGAADLPKPVPGEAFPILTDLPAPLSTTDCQAEIGISCYTPVQYQAAYDLNPLYHRGITGRGRTIVIVDPFGSPTIRHDLRVFDARFGFPDTDVRIVKFGDVPAFDPTNPVLVEWAAETTVDVEYAHAAAPGAKIVLAETAVSETEGVTGFPEVMNAEESLINAGVGDVISQSFGAAEGTFPGVSQGDFASLLNLRYAFKDAVAHHVTEVGISGDSGVTSSEADGSTLYPVPVTTWPSTDPLVTSVGGSQLYLDNGGRRLRPDTVWNDGYGAGGGGVSSVFTRPRYQQGVRGAVGGMRGTPDISVTAAVNGGCWVYLSFAGLGGTGWDIFVGTSQAAPIFSGIVALADQVAGHRLGLINPALYKLGELSREGDQDTGIVDITQGNNSFGEIGRAHV